MISFFPSPYPDELWYSVICRYHVHSGNYCAKHTLRQLYGDNFCAPSLMLCGPIKALLAQLPQGFLSAKDVVMQHTFYPYYARFFPTQRKRSSYAYRDGSVYHAVLDSALRSRGWRSLTGGRTYATKIETALLNLYGSYIPTADLSTKQLHATLCSKSVALRYVLQLAVLLGLSLHDLLHAPDAVPDYKAEMKAMYQSGASMYHIAQLYGIDAKTVARWIKS